MKLIRGTRVSDKERTKKGTVRKRRQTVHPLIRTQTVAFCEVLWDDGTLEPVNETELLPVPSRQIMVIGQNYWGKGDTIREAQWKAKEAGWRGGPHVIYDVDEKSYVNDLGDIQYPRDSDPPRLIDKVGIDAKKKKAMAK